MYFKLIPYLFRFHQKIIKKTFQGIVLMAMSHTASYATDESESGFLASSTKSTECELTDKTSEKCPFVDWMGSIGKNTFNRKSLEDQQHIRENVTRYASQISELICEKIDRQMLVKRIFSENDFEKEEPEDQKKIADYIRQIANDENPIKESPLLAIKDENNPNHRLVSEIAAVLYKIVTGEMFFINDKLTEHKIFAYMPRFSGLEQPSIARKLPSSQSKRQKAPNHAE